MDDSKFGRTGPGPGETSRRLDPCRIDEGHLRTRDRAMQAALPALHPPAKPARPSVGRMGPRIQRKVPPRAKAPAPGLSRVLTSYDPWKALGPSHPDFF